MASTHEIHRADHTLFTEPYRESRRNRDYSYHSNYTLARQDLQDSIIARFLGGIARPDSEGSDSPVGAPKPWILFTSGGPGVGKTTAVQWMYDSGLLPLQRFVVVDPDCERACVILWVVVANTRIPCSYSVCASRVEALCRRRSSVRRRPHPGASGADSMCRALVCRTSAPFLDPSPA